MLRYIAAFAVLVLSACGGGETPPPRISPASGGDYVPTGMSYKQFAAANGGGTLETQKRFLMLDHNNNGLLSDEELGTR